MASALPLTGAWSTDREEPVTLKRQLIGDFSRALRGLHQNSKLLFRGMAAMGAPPAGGAARRFVEPLSRARRNRCWRA